MLTQLWQLIHLFLLYVNCLFEGIHPLQQHSIHYIPPQLPLPSLALLIVWLLAGIHPW